MTQLLRHGRGWMGGTALPAPSQVSPDYGPHIGDWMKQPGDQVLTVTDGSTLDGANINTAACHHAATGGTYNGWLIIRCQTAGGSTLDLSATGMTIGTPLAGVDTDFRIMLCGFNVIHGGVQQYNAAYFRWWYPYSNYGPDEWWVNYQAVGGGAVGSVIDSVALDKMVNPFPTFIRNIQDTGAGRAATTTFGVYGGDIRGHGDDGMFFSGIKNGEILGTSIVNINSHGKSPRTAGGGYYWHPDALQWEWGDHWLIDYCLVGGSIQFEAFYANLDNFVFGTSTANFWQGGSPSNGMIYDTAPSGGSSIAANPNASASANAVLVYLYSLSSRTTHKTISGQFLAFVPGSIPGNFDAVNTIHTNTGKYLGLVGGDYGFQGGDFTATNTLMTTWWNAGGLVTLSYHMPNPFTGGDCFDRNSVDIPAMLTPGNPARTAWLAEMDTAAVGLKSLSDAGVVVLWRPFHEMNDTSFWWAGRDKTQFKALWVDMFNYFTTTKGLNNLLWVYGSGGSESDNTDWYPGSAYVDVVGGDIYDVLWAGRSAIAGLDNLATLGKPMALTEFGDTENPYDWRDVLDYIKVRYPQLCYILVWSGPWGMDKTTGTNSSAFLNDSWMANRDNVDLTATNGQRDITNSSVHVRWFNNGQYNGGNNPEYNAPFDIFDIGFGAAPTGLTITKSHSTPASETVSANLLTDNPTLDGARADATAPHKVWQAAHPYSSWATFFASNWP